MSGWKPSKIQVQGLLSGTFQTQSQDDNGVWPLVYGLLMMWKKLGKAEWVEIRIGYTFLHGVFIFSRLLSLAEDSASRPWYSSLRRGLARPGLWCAFGSWRYQHPKESAAPSRAAGQLGALSPRKGWLQVLCCHTCLSPSIGFALVHKTLNHQTSWIRSSLTVCSNEACKNRK